MRKNTVIFRFLSWIVLAAMLLVNVTPAASAPLAQDEVQATPTPTLAPEIQALLLQPLRRKSRPMIFHRIQSVNWQFPAALRMPAKNLSRG